MTNSNCSTESCVLLYCGRDQEQLGSAPRYREVMPTQLRSPALSLVGFGTLLLLTWRFLPLPWSVSMPLLSVAMGALAGGVGLLCRDARHWRRLALLGMALFAGGLILFEVSSRSAESLPVAFGLVITASGVLSRCPRWAIIPATAPGSAAGFCAASRRPSRPHPRRCPVGYAVGSPAVDRHSGGSLSPLNSRSLQV